MYSTAARVTRVLVDSIEPLANGQDDIDREKWLQLLGSLTFRIMDWISLRLCFMEE